MSGVRGTVQSAVELRWKKIPPEIYEGEYQEVLSGILGRQAVLTIQLAQAPSTWNGHVAPLILRAMVDAHINLAWIAKDPKDRARKYILYGLGQEKLIIEHFKEEEKANPNDDVKRIIEVRSAWLNNQRADYLTDINLGSWSGKSVRDMAIEADCYGLYKFAYTPFSVVVHNMWPHISTYNLRPCQNPLHHFHNVPQLLDFYSDADYVYRSSKYLAKSLRVFDKVFSLDIGDEDPEDFFIREMDSINEANSTEQKEE